MRLEDNFKIVGEKVVLVPYRQSHVPKYHEWMGDEEILRLTGSDRLTLDEEFEMQRSWTEDTDKCTFIILDAELWRNRGDEVASMVGDTNLFFNVNCPEDDDETQRKDQNYYSVAEIEIMIAEATARRKGFAKESLSLMMEFGKERLGVQKYLAKIKDDNHSSIALFKKLGFQETGRSNVFREVNLERHV